MVISHKFPAGVSAVRKWHRITVWLRTRTGTGSWSHIVISGKATMKI